LYAEKQQRAFRNPGSADRSAFNQSAHPYANDDTRRRAKPIACM
jgi:hypothetical protein